jgi:hypothetical protein
MGAAEEALLRVAARGAGVQLPPVTAVAGALAAMEALKALTHTLHPLTQWLHLDAAECEDTALLPELPAALTPPSRTRQQLQQTTLSPSSSPAQKTRFSPQAELIGAETQEALGAARYLVRPNASLAKVVCAMT